MKFTFSLKSFIAGLLIILLINYSTFFGSEDSITDSTTSSILTYTIEKGDIENSIDVVGEAALVDEQSLSFNQAGTITAIYFDAGDSVSKGDIIAQLDDSDGYDNIEEAEITLENAQISLSQLYEDVDESQIIQAKNSIKTAEDNLLIAQKELENLKITQQNSLNELLQNIDNLEKTLENSKNSLALSEEELEILKQEQNNSLSNTISNKENTIDNIEDDLRSNYVQIDQIIEEADYIMGVTDENKDKNDDYEDYLGAKDNTTKSEAKYALIEVISTYEDLGELLNSYSYSGSIDELMSLLEEYIDIYNKIYNTTNLIYQTVDASIESEGTLSESEIESMKSTMSSYRSTALSKITSLNSSINTLNTLTDVNLLTQSNTNTISSKEESIKSTKLSIEKQELEIENAKKDYQSTLTDYNITLESKEKNLEDLETSLELAKINYDELLEGPTSENVAKAQNTIKQAQMKLESAYDSLEDYQLTAPFDGVVRKIDYMVGDKITNDTDKSVYIENPNLLEISVYLDQIDIVTVEEGNEAIVTFDAYSTIDVDAKISSIDTTPVENSGVVSYEVKLVLNDDNFDKKVLSGMTADVEIISESVEDALLVKTTAITEIDGKFYVTLFVNGEQIQTEIETGIASSGLTEVISGLNEGNIVVLEDYTQTVTTTEETSTSLFGGGGGTRDMGGPPGGF